MGAQAKVAVIGGGIFGACAALELSKSFSVSLLERSAELLTGATYANHNRHHYGFHYPRSPETALQCLESRSEFEEAFGDCLDWNFQNYYALAKEDSKTSPEQYLSFCRSVGLKVEEGWPEDGVLDRSKLALCLKAREAVYDIARLRGKVKTLIAGASGLRLLLGHRVLSARFGPVDRKILSITGPEGRFDEEFDAVVDATYGNTNRFTEWLDFAPRGCQFNLQELDVIELPLDSRIGLTIQDGPFPSAIPLANTRLSLLAHVNESQLLREISREKTPLLHRVPYIESNWDNVLRVSSEYIPILRKARYIRSIFVDRIVDSARLTDDSRVTEVTEHGRGCWSVFSAKVITCVSTARKLQTSVSRALGSPA